MKRKIVRRLFPVFMIGLMLFSSVPAAAAADSMPAAGEETLPLTAEEQEYVRSAGTLKVGYVQDRVPVSFNAGDGELGGISRYIFDRVEQLSGLDFAYVPLPEGAVTYDYLQKEGFALVTSVEYNEENKKANGILISDPYLSSRKVIVARNDLDFNPRADLRAALSSGSQTIRKVLGGLFPNFSLDDYDSIADCFDAVKAGKADLTIQNQFVVEYWMTKPAYDELQAIPMGLEDQLCFSAVVAFGGGEGIPAEEGSLLIGILDKAIAAMSEDEVSNFTIRGVLENQYNFQLEDFIFRYRYPALALGLSALVILGLAILLMRQRVQAMRVQAEAKAKGEFLSTMSHEIRTPLNGLIGLNYLMQQNLHRPDRLEVYLHQSKSTANYLLGLVSDILDMSRLQDGKMELAAQPVDLSMMVDTVSTIVSNGMEEGRIDFQVEKNIAWPCVIGDELRIQQVILNLLDNARKFTPSGGSVKLLVGQTMNDGENVVTQVDVIDNGKGMSSEFQKRVFHSFAQELDTVSKGNQGTGLGLPISLELAKMMGGDLTFTSKKNAGSHFVFTFSGKQADLPRKEAPEAAAASSARPRVLVAEDNELNSEILQELLADAGFETVLAKNGREAVELFQQFEPGTFGVILMDLLMPEMDGFQAAAAIRALDRPDARTVRIIACTANSFAEDRQKALDSGMDDFVAKPVDVDELLKKLSET